MREREVRHVASGTVMTALLIVFLGFMLFLGWITRKWIASSSDYLAAGREVSLLINILGVSAIGWAGTSVAQSPGLAIRGGLIATLAFAATYALLGVLVYGVLFAGLIRRTGAYTLPEWLEVRYSPGVRIVVSAATVLAMIGITANNVLAIATVIHGFTGWPMFVCNAVSILTFLLFTVAGGLWAVTITDFAQMVLGLIGVPLLLITLGVKFGGLSWVAAGWPGPAGMWGAGVAGWQLPVLSVKFPSLLTFALLYGMLLVWGSQHYWIRVCSVRSERVARLSYIWAGVILFLINLLLGAVGLYAAAKFPGQFQPVGKLLPEAAYGVLLREFPVAVASYLLIFAVAASMSTASTTLMAGASTAVRDLYQRVFRPAATPKELVLPARAVTIAIGLLCWLLLWFPGGPLYLFAFGVAWLGPSSMLLLLGFYWRRATATGALVGALCGLGAMTVWTALDLLKVYKTSAIAHVGVVGVLCTLVPLVLVSLVTQPKYYGLPTWRPVGGGITHGSHAD